MENIKIIYKEIQDNLVPILDTYEQAIYHYIFRHTYIIGKSQTYFITRTAEIGYGKSNAESKPSGVQKSKKLRSLERKGAIKIIERSNKGILVEIVLPNDIQGLIEEESKVKIDIDSLDFYQGRKLLPAIIEREEYRCFYTGKKIKEDNCYLDHVVPQSNGGNNSYKNIVACCYDANSMKGSKNVDDFLRDLFKEGILSLQDFNTVKEKLINLREGKLIPNEEKIMELINN